MTESIRRKKLREDFEKIKGEENVKWTQTEPIYRIGK